MKSDDKDGYRERTYAVSSGDGPRIGSGRGIRVVVLAEAPNVVEVWSKTFVLGEDPKAVLTMQVVGGQVVEKCVSLKNTWHPETLAHEVKTGGEITSRHQVQPNFTVESVYFGKVEISETITFRIDDGSYVPKGPSYEAQHPMPEDSHGWEK
jgi:hypothetical protein